MSENISFIDEITEMERALVDAQKELSELQRRRDLFDVQTQQTRTALNGLRAALRGEKPPLKRKSRMSTAAIDPVEVDPVTNRPSRGARREQIEDICRKIGAGGREFRTIEVLKELSAIEGDLSDGMRSYTYAVMSSLEAEHLISKMGRGRWVISALA